MASPDGLGQLVFYPEGTRTKPGTSLPYKHGVGSIQRATGLPIVPVAVNCGMFWPKRGFPIRGGTAVIEFLPVLPAGERAGAVMETLFQQIEPASLRLYEGKVIDGRAQGFVLIWPISDPEDQHRLAAEISDNLARFAPGAGEAQPEPPAIAPAEPAAQN